MATTDPDDHPAIERDGLVDVLVQSSFTTMAVLNRVGAEHELSLTQLRVLAILRDRRVTMTALADHLGLDKSTMTGLVDRAVKRGLLVRARNADDGRSVDVFLSADGVALAGRLAAQVSAVLTPLTSALAPADRARLQTLLGRVFPPG